jgi:spore coat polysaccharide biosynthesis protein SpsF
VVCALPDSKADDVLHDYLRTLGANVYRGSESDVVARYHAAAHSYNADHIVRICADNPLVTATEIDHLISFYAMSEADYAYNHVPRENLYPDGIGAEITSMGIIDEIFLRAKTPAQREHLFNFILENSTKYRIATFDPLDEMLTRPDIKLDIDTLDDYAKLLDMPLHIDMTAREVISLFGGSL